MGGCSDSERGCPSAGGCGTSKQTQRALIGRVLGHAYPSARWGVLDDEARFRRGVGREGGQRLARALAEALRAPTLFVDGAPDELCDFIYVLCVGREPGLIWVREGLGELEPGAAELLPSDKVLRVALSSLARIACVQECTVTLAADLTIHEAPRAGVYDPVLLKRFQKTIDLLEASGVRHLDMGLLELPAAGMDDGAYVERFGEPPRVVNYLFYPQPTNTVRIVASAAAVPVTATRVESHA